jgi:hypothetical protein
MGKGLGRRCSLVLLTAIWSGVGAAVGAQAQTQLPGVFVTTPSPVTPSPPAAHRRRWLQPSPRPQHRTLPAPLC